jgi:hypothetical protein
VVRHAEEASGYGWESARFNPRRLWSRAPRLSTEDSALVALYEVVAQVQHIAETLLTSRDAEGAAPRGLRLRHGARGPAGRLAGAVAVYQNKAADRRTDRAGLEAALRRVREHRASLARTASAPELLTDWSVHAAALLAVGRAYQALLAV